MKIPSVIALSNMSSRRNIPPSRASTCSCATSSLPILRIARELTFDHVIPRRQGGRTTWENVATACARATCKKGGRTPREARMPLHVDRSARPAGNCRTRAAPFRPTTCTKAGMTGSIGTSSWRLKATGSSPLVGEDREACQLGWLAELGEGRATTAAPLCRYPSPLRPGDTSPSLVTLSHKGEGFSVSLATSLISLRGS